MEKRVTSFSMLSPASGFLVPWHSKQYFWNAAGGVAEGRGVCAAGGVNRGAAFADAARRGPNAGAWADRIDASATTEAAHNAGRVMGLQARAGNRFQHCKGWSCRCPSRRAAEIAGPFLPIPVRGILPTA